jgi:hypothetical protein
VLSEVADETPEWATLHDGLGFVAISGSSGREFLSVFSTGTRLPLPCVSNDYEDVGKTKSH